VRNVVTVFNQNTRAIQPKHGPAKETDGGNVGDSVGQRVREKLGDS